MCLIPLMKGERSRSGSLGRLNVGKALEEAPEHHVDLLAGEMGPEAEVRPRRAEADVGVGVAAHVEGVGVVEHVLVPVGRVVEHDDLVAFVQLGLAEHRVAGHGAAHPDDRGGPAHDLVDAGGRDPGRVRRPQCPLVRVLR